MASSKFERVRSSKFERLVRERERQEITGVSRTAWWRLRRDGLLPFAPVQLHGSAVGWRLSDLQAWIASRPEVGRPAEQYGLRR